MLKQNTFMSNEINRKLFKNLPKSTGLSLRSIEKLNDVNLHSMERIEE